MFQKEHLDSSHSNLKCDYCGNQSSSVNAFNQHKLTECTQRIAPSTSEASSCSEQVSIELLAEIMYIKKSYYLEHYQGYK